MPLVVRSVIAALVVCFGIAAGKEPMPVGVAGLTHTHVHWLFESEKRGDVVIVGIAEADRALAKRYLDQYGKDASILYDDLDTMIEETDPVGVLAFGSIAEHRAVVEAAAPRGIHVMVEKPLAVDMKDAQRMKKLADRHGIHLLTNYETTWYPTNHVVKERLEGGTVGPLRKVVFRHGHEGPANIGVDAEFLSWLTDPDENGGGAIVDFGCYGANLMTWLMDGRKPRAVTAMTAQLQPDLYPNVDDEAVILLDYGDATAVIQASWNWPISVKDMVVYGEEGVLTAADRETLVIRPSEEDPAEVYTLDPRDSPYDDPFALFRAVVDGEVTLADDDLSALENNMTVVEILDAARHSARTGRRVELD